MSFSIKQFGEVVFWLYFEAVNFEIKHASNKFLLLLSNILLLFTTVSYELKKVIIDVEIWIIETYYSLLKSHETVRICTVCYVEYFVNSKEIIFGAALHSKSGYTKHCNFLYRKVHHGCISASFTKFWEPSSRTHFVNE